MLSQTELSCTPKGHTGGPQILQQTMESEALKLLRWAPTTAWGLRPPTAQAETTATAPTTWTHSCSEEQAAARESSSSHQLNFLPWQFCRFMGTCVSPKTKLDSRKKGTSFWEATNEQYFPKQRRGGGRKILFSLDTFSYISVQKN